MIGLREMDPGIEFPALHQVASVDQAICARFAELALPMMLREQTGIFHVCDKGPEISQITDQILKDVIDLTGDFDGPTYASNTGYNFPNKIYCRGDNNSFHSDGCNQVAIISTSGSAFLHLAWLPHFDKDGVQFLRDKSTETTEKITMLKGGKPAGYVAPVEIIECKPGTLVRINQPEECIIDVHGNEWDLLHGLYNARGQRISLMFRSYGPKGCTDGCSLERAGTKTLSA